MNEINNPAAKEFIRQIEDLAGKSEELSALCPHVNSSGCSKQLKVLTGKLSSMPESELIEAYNVLTELPGWQRLPLSMDDVIVKVRKVAEAQTAGQKERSDEAVGDMVKSQCCGGKAQLKSESLQANAVTAQLDCTLGDCPDGPSQVQVDDLAIAVAAADLATAIAKEAADIVAIFSEKIGKILTAVASGLDVVAKGLALGVAIMQRQADVVAECEDAAVKRLLLGMCNKLNVMDAKLDAIIAKLEIMDKKLDEILKLLHEIKEIVTEILMHQIEEALTECKLLVDLYLPDSAFGSISKVQAIVETLIRNSKLAGRTVANAEAYFRQGSAALLNEQYEKALEWFMLSYRQLQFKDACSVPCPSNPCCT